MAFLGCLLVFLGFFWVLGQKSVIVSLGKSVVLLGVMTIGIVLTIVGH